MRFAGSVLSYRILHKWCEKYRYELVKGLSIYNFFIYDYMSTQLYTQCSYRQRQISNLYIEDKS